MARQGTSRIGGAARLSVAFAAAGLAACGGDDSSVESLGRASSRIDAPLPAAFCEIQIEGGPLVDTETDYLPNLIQCENGAAGLEALKAQAIAARSVAYWYMATYGEVCDSQSCQVYSCGKTPDAIHQQAVDETSGIYLAYNGNLTYASYVAGDPDTAPPACIGQNETYITYNEGKTGTDVEQTSLLFQHDPTDAAYGQNRGCMSQNGGACLEDVGYDALEILSFYYGADIDVLQAPGPCVLRLPGEGGSGGAGVGGGGAAGPPASSPASTGAGGDGGAATSAGDPDDGGCGCAIPGAPDEPTRAPLAVLFVIALAVTRSRARDRSA